MSIFLVIFGAHLEILFIIKVKILEFIKWPSRFLQLRWLLSLEWLSCFENTIESLLSTCISGICSWSQTNHTPLKYRCLIKTSDWISHVYLIAPKRSGYPKQTHNTKKSTLCTIITCSINPFRVHIWARSCDQGEGSLIHTNTSGWCYLSLSITIMNLIFAFKMHYKETQVLLSNLRLATQNKHITKNQHGVSQSCIWC